MLTDEVLVDRVIAGFDGAFDELYQRHAQAAWRLAQAVTGNSHDAADAVSEAFARVLQAVRAGRLDEGAAFRSYLLTATRNAALDGMRRSGRARAADDVDLDLVATAEANPAERLAGGEDAVLVAEAFRNLPERWRSVLWLTEVEGVATKDAAEQLGLTANGTAQLAVRARAGLRERYLQAHVRGETSAACRFTVDRLGAYVGAGLSHRDLAKVDQHLAGCQSCRERKEELEDVGSTLRRIVLPIPLALGAISATKVHAALISASLPAPVGVMERAVQLAKQPTPLMRRVTATAAAGVLVLGLLSLRVVGKGDEKVRDLAAPPGTAAPADLDLPQAQLSVASSPLLFGGLDYFAPHTGGSASADTAPATAETGRGDGSGPATSDGAGGAAGDDGGARNGGTPTAAASPTSLVETTVGANLGGATAGLTVGIGPEPVVDLTLNGAPVVGDPVDTPGSNGVQIIAGGSAVPTRTVSLP